jgi:cytochrome c
MTIAAKRTKAYGMILSSAFLALGAFGLGGCSPSFPINEPIPEPPSSQPSNPPNFGSTITQPTAPPPISGGTLTVLADGTTAVAADPDRDRIYVVNLDARTKLADLALLQGDEPGRVIEDGKGRVHVVLRSAGMVSTLTHSETTGWSIALRRKVCPAPRGIAWNESTDELFVACAGGELVTLPGGGGERTRTVEVERDLRDVLILDGKIYISKFRAAELLEVDPSGLVVGRTKPPISVASQGSAHSGSRFSPNAAWRVVASGDRVYMLHQRGLDSTIGTVKPGGYGGGGGFDNCESSIVQTTISDVTPGRPSVNAMPSFPSATFAVDVAFNPNVDRLAVVSPGNAHNPLPTIAMARAQDLDSSTRCVSDDTKNVSGEPIAAAYTSAGTLVVQTRQPASIVFPDYAAQDIVLSTEVKADTGHAVFHANSGAGLACASCHLEGGEDGRTWAFENSGPRRTQSIRGGILGTEPFHWDGDQNDFGVLMKEVFAHRMSGPELAADQLTAMKGWVDNIPLLRTAPPADPEAVARGKALFEDAENVGCTSCHAGPRGTNNASVDVGTGARFQVPSLRGVAFRGPFLHDGRAHTLAERFGADGGGDQHGHTSQLSADQIADLVAYLETL